MKEETLNLVIELLQQFQQYGYQKEQANHPLIAQALEKAGVPTLELNSAMIWLRGCKQQNHLQAATDTSVRILSTEEEYKISGEAHKFLMRLQALEVIDTRLREHIIEKIMDCDFDEISISQVKWITYLVLAHHDQQATSWLGDVITAGNNSPLTAH